MLVKILSMQRVVNYGSFMQAYALQKVVESLGYRAVFCDFAPGEPRHRGAKVFLDSKLTKIYKKIKSLGSIKQLLEQRRFRRRKTAYFKRDAWPLLGLSETRDLDYRADCLIIGSDEVFNYTQNHTFGYVPAFFGHGIEAKSIIAYAASAGYATSDDIQADGMEDEISSGLRKFKRIGVRDQNTYDIVMRYSGTQPTFVIDPTLLYDFTAEVPSEPAARIPRDYLLIYAYNGRLDSPEEIGAIRNYARARGLKIVSVAFYHGWCDQNLVVTPFDLLAIFEKARCVITDTFHGTIFSIKHRKPFVSLLREQSARGSNLSKVGFLLQQLGLEDRINQDLDQLASQMERPIDYATVQERLNSDRSASLEFLRDALQA